MDKPQNHFLRNKNLLRTLDIMASRYHCLPSRLLALSVDEWSVNALVMQAGLEAEARAAKETRRR